MVSCSRVLKSLRYQKIAFDFKARFYPQIFAKKNKYLKNKVILGKFLRFLKLRKKKVNKSFTIT